MGNKREIKINIYQDGENEPIGMDEIVTSWSSHWDMHYKQHGNLVFYSDLNIKKAGVIAEAPEKLQNIAIIRNPDISFVLEETGKLLGGIEITTHSPDGSNVEKRYPFLWASNKQKCHGFIVCPYQKSRPDGQVNKLPYRYTLRNKSFIKKWDPAQPNTNITQTIPIKELQTSLSSVPDAIRSQLFTFDDIGNFFADVLALEILQEGTESIVERLNAFKLKMEKMVDECLRVTQLTEASSLLKIGKRWIQTYNVRPVTGHWERGEGQFDSIDGRLMFTLDEINDLPEKQKPDSFEFWLPQMTKYHPWIVEQQKRGYKSKRFGNIMIHLKDSCDIKFVEDLNEEEWKILKSNKRVLLERLDSPPGIYYVFGVSRLIGIDNILNSDLLKSDEAQEAIQKLVSDKNLYFSTHRAYIPGWEEDLLEKIKSLPENSLLLVPRITSNLLSSFIGADIECKIIAAEDCAKIYLLLLRQIEKYRGVQKWLDKEKSLNKLL